MAETSRQVIVITGVTRGLGRALAEGFAGLGHAVVGCGRSAEEIERLRRDPGAPEDFAVVDVTRADQVAAWAARTLDRHGAAQPAAEQRRRDQPQRAALGGPRRRVRPGDRREPQGRGERDPALPAADARPPVGGRRQPELVLGPVHVARGRPLLRDQVGHRGPDPPWRRSCRRAWPPSPSTPASSTPRCSAAPSAPRPGTTSARGNGPRPPCRSC